MPTGSFGSIGFVTEKEFTAENYPRALYLRVTNHLSRLTFPFVFSVFYAVNVQCSAVSGWSLSAAAGFPKFVFPKCAFAIGS